MSKAEFRVAYDGTALAGHTMDVRDLAPALLALSELLVETNKVLNGQRAALEVHVTPKVDENCFDIGLEVLQTWGKVKEFLGLSDVVSAKELIDWLIYGYAGRWGILKTYHWMRGQPPMNVIHFQDENGNPLVRMQFADREDEICDLSTYELIKNDKIRLNVGRILKPLLVRKGISKFIAYQNERKDDGVTISKEEAGEMDFSPVGAEEVDDHPTPGEPFEAMLKVYSPVYDVNAPRWRFWYGKQRFYMDISESNIGEVVLRHGGVLVDDWFRVMLQVEEGETTDGRTTMAYKVMKVLDFIPAPRQTDMFSNETNNDAEEG